MYLNTELGNSIGLLRLIKNTIDPNHVMNPGALLYEDEDEERAEKEEMEKYHSL